MATAPKKISRNQRRAQARATAKGRPWVDKTIAEIDKAEEEKRFKQALEEKSIEQARIAMITKQMNEIFNLCLQGVVKNIYVETEKGFNKQACDIGGIPKATLEEIEDDEALAAIDKLEAELEEKCKKERIEREKNYHEEQARLKKQHDEDLFWFEKDEVHFNANKIRPDFLHEKIQRDENRFEEVCDELLQNVLYQKNKGVAATKAFLQRYEDVGPKIEQID